jgi:hypothetical protein
MAIRSTQLPLQGRVRATIATVVGAFVLALVVVALASQVSAIWTDPARIAPADVAPAREHAVTLPVFVHPGAHRGQVRFGRFDHDPAPVHGPNQRPKWGD